MSRKRRYDWLIVGSGLYGATFAYMVRRAGKRCLVMTPSEFLKEEKNVNIGYIYLNSCRCNAFVLINVRLFKKMFVPLQPETG